MDDATPPPHPDPSPGSSQPDQRLEPGAVAFLTMGVAVALSLVLGGLLGYLVDGWAHTGPVFTLVGLAFGVVVAVLLIVTRVRKYL